MSLTLLGELWAKLYVTRLASVIPKIKEGRHMWSLKRGEYYLICANSQSNTGGNVLSAGTWGASRSAINSVHPHLFKILLTLRQPLQYISQTLLRIGAKGLHVFHGRCMSLGDQAPAKTGISMQPSNLATFCNLHIVCLQPAGQQSCLLGTYGTFFQ